MFPSHSSGRSDHHYLLHRASPPFFAPSRSSPRSRQPIFAIPSPTSGCCYHLYFFSRSFLRLPHLTQVVFAMSSASPPYVSFTSSPPSFLRESCSAKRTSLRAATSMSSRASSLATSAERRWGRSSESCMVRTFQHATLRFAVFFFLSLFFLLLGRDAHEPLLANQVRQALFRPPFVGPSPCGASSAVPKEGCLVAQSAAKCCRCLRSTDKRPIQLSHLHAEWRLWLPVPSSTCHFHPSPWLQGFSFLPALNAYSGHQLVRTNSTF